MKRCGNFRSGEHTLQSNKDGKLSTSLPTDVFSLVNVQAQLIHEYLVIHRLNPTDSGPTLVISLTRFIVSSLREIQTKYRDYFLSSLENCCAAANDFFRMTNLTESMVDRIIKKYKAFELEGRPLLDILSAEVQELVSLYSYDAVYAAQMTYSFVFEPIKAKLAKKLFGPQWELKCTSNEIALSITQTIQDFVADIETYLKNIFLAKKVMDVLVKATVNFYIKCIVMKARATRNLLVNAQQMKKGVDTHRFKYPQRAVWRMCGDVYVLKQFFTKFCERMRALNKIITKEFAPLIAILEYMIKVAEFAKNGYVDEKEQIDARDLIMLLQKYTANIRITKLVAIDLWWLIMPDGEDLVFDVIRDIKGSLKGINQEELHDDSNLDLLQRQKIPGIALSEVFAKIYKWDLHPLNITDCSWLSHIEITMEDDLEQIAKESAKKAKKKAKQVVNCARHINCMPFYDNTVAPTNEQSGVDNIFKKLQRNRDKL